MKTTTLTPHQTKQKENINIANNLKGTYLKIFPNGYANISKACLGHSIHLSIGLIGNIKECSNGICLNDAGYGVFSIDIEDGFITIERSYHNLSCKPESKYYAMSHQKVSFRKIKAKDIGKALELFHKYISRFAAMVIEQRNNDNILNQDTIKPIYLNGIFN